MIINIKIFFEQLIKKGQSAAKAMSRQYRKHNKDINNPNFPHGEFAGYRAGCKCEACNNANNEKKKNKYREQNPKEIKLTKICKNCLEEKPLSDFYFHKEGKWPEPNCKLCTSILKKKYRLLKEYNLTTEDYISLYKKQEGKCAICAKSFSDIKNAPHVDHCHETGKVRGLLCSKCNPALGLFNDDCVVILNAAKYIARFNDYPEREYILSKMEMPSSSKLRMKI